MKITRIRLFLLGLSCWTFASLAPYLAVGETWSMVWFEINYPISAFAKNFGALEYCYPYLYIGITTVLNSLLVGLLFSTIGGYFVSRRKARK